MMQVKSPASSIVALNVLELCWLWLYQVLKYRAQLDSKLEGFVGV